MSYCFSLDANWRNFKDAITSCLSCSVNRDRVVSEIKALWTNENNPNHVLPCLSVRSGFDLYLKVMDFPPGSEVIMSAVNIPDMITVVKHHKLKVSLSFYNPYTCKTV